MRFEITLKEDGWIVKVCPASYVEIIKFFKKEDFQKVLKYISDKEDEYNPCESE